MSTQQTSGFCAQCQEQRLFTRHRMQMGVHGILTLLTCGIWLIPFLILYLVNESKPFMCAKCGGTRQVSKQTNQELSPELETANHQSRLFSTLKFAGLVVAGILGCVVLLILAQIIMEAIEKSNELSKNMTVEYTKKSRPATAPNPQSPDYKSGYKKGQKEGNDWAKKGGTHMPYPLAIRNMAGNEVLREKGIKDKSSWQSGWYDGFVSGYRSLKSPKIAKNKLENLSWKNAKPKVKVHDNEGNHQATIVRVERSSGLIVVKHVRSGIVDKKDLKSLSWYWFVRKDDPALR